MTTKDKKDFIEAVAEGVRRALAGLKLVEESTHPVGGYKRARDLAIFQTTANTEPNRKHGTA